MLDSIWSNIYPFIQLFLALFAIVVVNAPQLIGFALPPLIQVLNKEVYGEHERFIVSCVICLFSAVILKWGELTTGNPEAVANWAAIVFAESQLVYKLYFKSSALSARIDQAIKPSAASENIS